MVGSSPELAIDGDSGTCARTPRTAAQRWWQVAFTRKASVRTVRIVTEGQVFFLVFSLFYFFPGARLDRVRDRAAGGQPHVVQAVWKTSWIPRGVRISSS